MLDQTIESLAERIMRLQAGEEQATAEVASELAGLGRKCGASKLARGPILAAFLQAAHLITAQLGNASAGVFEESHRILMRLILQIANLVEEEKRERRKLAAAPPPQAPESPRTEPAPAPSVVRRIHEMLLGELMVDLGTLTDDEVDHALSEQRFTGRPFGELAVHLGYADQEQVDRALDVQENARSHAPLPRKAETTRIVKASGLPGIDRGLQLTRDMRVGDHLLKHGKISAEQLEIALRMQRATGSLLGEALMESGAVSRDDVRTAVQQQRDGRELGGMFAPRQVRPD